MNGHLKALTANEFTTFLTSIIICKKFKKLFFKELKFNKESQVDKPDLCKSTEEIFSKLNVKFTTNNVDDNKEINNFFENFEKEEIVDPALLHSHKVANRVLGKMFHPKMGNVFGKMFHSKIGKNVGDKHEEEHKKEN